MSVLLDVLCLCAAPQISMKNSQYKLLVILVSCAVVYNSLGHLLAYYANRIPPKLKKNFSPVQTHSKNAKPASHTNPDPA